MAFFLDIDVNYNPVCLEIIDASKILDVNEKMLVNPKIKMDIDIKNDLIKICVTFYFEGYESVYSKNIANNFNIPEMNTILV